MDDWQRRHAEIPDHVAIPSDEKNELVGALQEQNTRLRAEIARMRVGGLGGGLGGESRSEIFKLKEEIERLRSENARLRLAGDPSWRYKKGLSAMKKVLELWLAGTVRGGIMIWRKRARDEREKWSLQMAAEELARVKR